jgi:DNA-directed RNA polymerase beta' subunit
MTCFEMLLDVQALKILRCIPHKVIEKLGMHNFVARPEALILMCLPVPPSCTCVTAPDTPSVVTKNQISVPIDVADYLTILERVTTLNIKQLQQYVDNGPHAEPFKTGAV